jgi:hypothetical protein
MQMHFADLEESIGRLEMLNNDVGGAEAAEKLEDEQN